MPIATADPKDKEEKAAVKLWLTDRMKILSGFCANGFCEGTKPKSSAGVPQKVCDLIYSCPCECHYRFDQMFNMTGNERVALKNPEYVPDFGNFVLPAPPPPVVVTVADDADGVDVPPTHERPVVTPSEPDTVPLSDRRGPLGTMAKGERFSLPFHASEACRRCVMGWMSDTNV